MSFNLVVFSFFRFVYECRIFLYSLVVAVVVVVSFCGIRVFNDCLEGRSKIKARKAYTQNMYFVQDRK